MGQGSARGVREGALPRAVGRDPARLGPRGRRRGPPADFRRRLPRRDRRGVAGVEAGHRVPGEAGGDAEAGRDRGVRVLIPPHRRLSALRVNSVRAEGAEFLRGRGRGRGWGALVLWRCGGCRA